MKTNTLVCLFYFCNNVYSNAIPNQKSVAIMVSGYANTKGSSLSRLLLFWGFTAWMVLNQIFEQKIKFFSIQFLGKFLIPGLQTSFWLFWWDEQICCICQISFHFPEEISFCATEGVIFCAELLEDKRSCKDDLFVRIFVEDTERLQRTAAVRPDNCPKLKKKSEKILEKYR